MDTEKDENPFKGMAEQTVTCPVRNPQTSGQSQTFRFCGKVDQVYSDPRYGMVVLRDWKTCSNAEQTSRLKVLSYQADLYAVALEEMGTQIDAVEFCLIERPNIKLCNKDATPEAYEQRCVEWLRQEGKLVEFRVPSTKARRAAARQWLWDIGQQILEARRSGRFLNNEQACYNWQRECDYMELCLACSQRHDVEALIESDFQKGDLHPELPEMMAGKDMLTFSSASCWALCQQKYRWRYERELVPRQSEDSEALKTGIRVHLGLEKAVTISLEAGLAEVSAAVLGIDTKGQQDRAKARAMVFAAFEKWG